MNLNQWIYKTRKKLAKNRLIDAIAKPIYMSLQKLYFEYSANSVLKKEVHTIEPKNIWYLDIPTHSNLGDLAQYWRIKLWLAENYPDYKVHEISAQTICYAEENFLSLMKKRKKDDLIFFQSGYCTQDLGGTHDYIHKLVIKAIKDIPIIMMPQTILYLNKENEKSASKIYSVNRNVFILCRDFVSLDIAKRIFPHNTVMAYPDIVTSMIGSLKVPTKDSRKGIMMCCRNDSEKYYSDESLLQLSIELKKIDNVTRSDTTVSCDYTQLKNDISAHVLEMIRDFMNYKLIITDRYHGTIFSLIAGTPVIVIKTNDHKVITGVDWFKGIYDKRVCYIENISDVAKKSEEIINSYPYEQPHSYFNENYYMKLKKVIDNWWINQKEGDL